MGKKPIYGIEDNHEALECLRNAQGSMENRMRAVYNYGYKDGFEDGVQIALDRTKEMTNRLLKEYTGEVHDGRDKDNKA